MTLRQRLARWSRLRVVRRAYWSLVVGGLILSLIAITRVNDCRQRWVDIFEDDPPAGVCSIEWLALAPRLVVLWVTVFVVWTMIAGLRDNIAGLWGSQDERRR
jgi:hypothetical protein